MADGNLFSMQAPAWSRMHPFEVFGDHAAMPGARLVIHVAVVGDVLAELIASRAQQAPALDPDLARITMRAGLGLGRLPLAEFVYATPEDAVVLVELGAGEGPGASMRAHDLLLSAFSSRLARLGLEAPALARVFEFPDLDVVRKALVSLQESIEETTPARTSAWAGAQLRGRGEPFHPSMIETLEEQTSLLESVGVDMEALPAWWWKGVAVRSSGGTQEVHDDLPHGDAFAALIGPG